MKKRAFLLVALLGQLIGLTVGTAHAFGPPPGRALDNYCEHAGPGTHANDPLGICDPPPPDAGGGY